jgi:hypothetical protein
MTHPFFVIELKADFSLDDCVDFINAVTEKGEKLFRSLYIALPLFRLKEITSTFPDSGITFGTALLNAVDEGAFTASVAGKMIKNAGGQFTLVGTAYERNQLKISDEHLEKKLKAATADGLKVIYCVGGGNEIDDQALVHQLQLLKTVEDPHPTIIYELCFRNFESYLPSKEELAAASDRIKKALSETGLEKCAILVALPADLIGFSSLIESLPFDGAFFTKSGAYPHLVHDETIKLVHVHCEDEKQ